MATSLRTDSAGKHQLQEIVGFCFDTLRTFGKEPEVLININKAFQFILADYSIEEISKAFKIYLSTKSEMPTPSDIVQLIKRDGRPPLSEPMYIALCQKRERTSFVDAGYHGNCLSTEEEKYIAEYECDVMGR